MVRTRRTTVPGEQGPEATGAASARQSTLRTANLALVARQVLSSPEPVSRADIAAETGIGLLPDFYVRPEDGFVQVGLGNTTEKEEFAADIYLVMHEDLRRSAKIRAVADFLGEVLMAQASVNA